MNDGSSRGVVHESLPPVPPGGLYKRAVGDLEALWHVDGGRTFFAGTLDYNASHAHGAPVFLAGIDGKFGLRIAGGDWLTCRTAVIPAGVAHELSIGGHPLAVLYIEPGVAGADALMPLVRDTREVQGALVGNRGDVGLLRALYEDRGGAAWAGEALSDLLDHSMRRASRPLDPRISRAVGRLSVPEQGLIPVARVAHEAGLSPSRFQRLFTQQVGVPFRRYRAWQRMRAAIREIVHGHSFTRAAHTAGFADQAHFAHDFRRTFGAPASRSLAEVRANPGTPPSQRAVTSGGQ